MKKNYDFSKLDAVKNPYAAILKSMKIEDVLIDTHVEKSNKLIKPKSN